LYSAASRSFRIEIGPSGEQVVGQKPGIVWIRIGKTSKQALLEWFKPLLPIIEQALAATECFIEII
jgi:hypothetical protein